jgi:hypothetical protein
MDHSSKRGKIPQQDWSAIMARYEAGETLASIARTYDCSPPAISYIVSRSRARGVAPSAIGSRRPASPEPPLVESDGIETPVHEPGREKTVTEQTPIGESGPRSPAMAANQTSQAVLQNGTVSNGGVEVPKKGGSERHDVDERKNVDAARASASDGGPSREDHRPLQTLHLSQPHRYDEPAARVPHHPSYQVSNTSNELVGSPVAPGHKDPGRSGNGADGRFVPDERNSKEGGTFIDLALRHRVQSDITAFLTAFDAALSQDTSETRTALREATDRLLRAGARTRIELERLEARMPLPARDGSRQMESPWRQR